MSYKISKIKVTIIKDKIIMIKAEQTLEFPKVNEIGER